MNNKTSTPKELELTEKDLEGREARCSQCGRVVPSSVDLPFFRYRPGAKYDSHYDGCRGYD